MLLYEIVNIINTFFYIFTYIFHISLYIIKKKKKKKKKIKKNKKKKKKRLNIIINNYNV